MSSDEDPFEILLPDKKRKWDVSIGWRKDERFVLFGLELFAYDAGWNSLLNIIYFQIAWFQLDIGYWFSKKDAP